MLPVETAAKAAAVAASGVTYPFAVAIGIPDALALPVAVAAAGGASWAMSNRSRLEGWSITAIFSAISAWFFSWMFGVLFGPLAGAALLQWLPDDYEQRLHTGALSVGFALILSAFAISHILPIVMRAFRDKVKQPDGSQ